VTFSIGARLTVISAVAFALLAAVTAVGLGVTSRELAWTVGVMASIAAFVTWWASRIALRPLGRVAAAARAVDVTNLEARLPKRGAGGELGDLVDSFNGTLGRLERAVGDMRQFSTALAHELRTPLTALRGEIELELRRPGGDPRSRAAMGSQLEEIDKLTRLIDQILTLARTESGQVQLTPAPVDLGVLATSLVDHLLPVAEARDIDLRCERHGTVVVQGDAAWLERLVLNLVDNALKFTHPGGRVTLRIRRAGRGAALEVQDTGVGMAPSVVPHIFDRFFRADPSRSSTIAGAGLGLSLVKWIVDSHHGTVSVESTPGRGSTFTVWIPSSGLAG
jgi:heavy metal sensor kinase